MSTAALNHVSPEEYLRLERMAEFKSEYIDGRVIAMTGVSLNHTRIVHNFSRTLGNQLLEGPCEISLTELRVKLNGPGYVYPDIVGYCEPRLEDAHFDTLMNPVLIIEVLSPSTEKYDRGEKLAKYRSLASVSEIVLVTQTAVLLERYVRTGDVWAYSKYSELDAALPLTSIGCEVPIRDIYARVAFSTE